jgi:tricorn protease
VAVKVLGADGTGLRRHTDHGGPGAPAFYVRHASTDGQRVVYESAPREYRLPQPS